MMMWELLTILSLTLIQCVERRPDTTTAIIVVLGNDSVLVPNGGYNKLT